MITRPLSTNTLKPTWRMVYVEDNPLNAMVVRSMLNQKRPDIALVICETGAATLAQLQREKPDFLLVDLMLPDTHGRELLKKIRADARFATIPAVATSSPLPPDVQSELLSQGFQQCLLKPIKVDALMQVVDRAMPRRQG